MNRTTFYFMRHAETDHNVYRIYNDAEDIDLNETGKHQAKKAQSLLQPLPLLTVCTSPLLRARRTTEIALENKMVTRIIENGFRECPGMLWKLFLASETRELSEDEWTEVHTFIQETKSALIKALELPGPVLIIAHGGTYWAITHLLKINDNRKIANCAPVRLSPHGSNDWKSEPLSHV
ncbi:MAG: histidine phosphatase family protein [Chlamydiales bacterium]|nr:histidine phosphatase family protein [Chlamydiales bacterium]